MSILALDLGTKTGWAFRSASGVFTADTEVLMTPKEVTAQAKLRGDRKLDARIPRLFNLLGDIHYTKGLSYIVFEDVQFASTTLQAHLWASLRATVWLFACQKQIRTECLATGRLKQFATGHGAATKDMMAAWLCKKCPEDFRMFDGALRSVRTNEKLDDNAVDAAHLLLWAEKIIT